MNKPTLEYVRGIIETIVSDYHENVERKNIRPIVRESGEMNFEIKLIYDISDEEIDWENVEINPNQTIEEVRTILFRYIDSIHPYYD